MYPVLPNPAHGISLLLVTLMSSSACGSPPSLAADPFRPTMAPGAGLSVDVVNHHVLDMRVYLVRGAVPIPLGSVGSEQRRTFRVSAAELGQSGAIRLMVDPLGSRTLFTSEIIHVAPGQHVIWMLAHRLRFSSVTVRQ